MEKIIRSKKQGEGVQRQESGSILILSSFILTTLAILCVAYWKLIENYTKGIILREKSLQTFQLAKSGIEDALFEIREGLEWKESALMIHNWQKVSGNTYIKSTNLGSINSTYFPYLATYSVTVSGDPSISAFSVTSKAEISPTFNPSVVYKKALQADVVLSPSSELYILKMQEI